MQDDNFLLQRVLRDLQRTGENNVPYICDYIMDDIRAARAHLKDQGIPDDESENYYKLLVGYSAWMYRSRVSGAQKPNYVRELHGVLQNKNLAEGRKR